MAAYTTIDDPSLYLRIKLYAGNATNDTAITWDETDTNMQPDLLWFKSRTDTQSHALWDSVRGALKRLIPNSTGAEGDEATNLDSFDSNGFTVDNEAIVNGSSRDYVCWGWKESATAGFDILTFEGNSTDDTDISHNLSAVPHWIICRNIDSAKDWCVYHHKNTSAPETDLLVLNTTAATTDTNDRWSDEAPTSSVFTIGDSSQLNASGDTSIAYLWSEKKGYSKFGTYASNSNADGPYVFVGFRIAWLMIKCTTAAEGWAIFDNKREPMNDGVMSQLNGNNAGSEGTLNILFTANGFKSLEVTGQHNKSGSHSYVYMAFAEAPFVNSNGVPANAR